MMSVVIVITFHSSTFYPTKITAVSCKGTQCWSLFLSSVGLSFSRVLAERKIKCNKPGLYPTHCLASPSFLLEGGDNAPLGSL